MRRDLNALALVPYPLGFAPSQRFRIEQWAPLLAEHGVRCEVAPLIDSPLFRRLNSPGRPLGKVIGVLRAAARQWRRVATEVRRYDLVFLHREALVFGPALLERLVARSRPTVFDFDDSIWLANENRVNPLAKWVKCPGKTRVIAAHARAVMAGNRYLATWAEQYNAAVHVVPTTIDMETYARQKTHEDADVPVIGWSGTTSTLRYLEVLLPVLQDAARRRRFRLLVIYNGSPQRWPLPDVEWRPWSASSEVDDLLAMDIGLMPQPDEEWAKGKCGLKALQYMALGIPTVASRNGVLPEIIQHGRSGLLATSHPEWIDALTMLVDDWKVRADIGREARTTVDERYGAAAHVPRIARILRDVWESSVARSA